MSRPAASSEYLRRRKPLTAYVAGDMARRGRPTLPEVRVSRVRPIPGEDMPPADFAAMMAARSATLKRFREAGLESPAWGRRRTLRARMLDLANEAFDLVQDALVEGCRRLAVHAPQGQVPEPLARQQGVGACVRDVARDGLREAASGDRKDRELIHLKLHGAQIAVSNHGRLLPSGSPSIGQSPPSGESAA